MTETFAKDFINAQSEIGTLPKDKNGYGYKYTDFDTVLTTVKPILKKNNMGFIQLLSTENGKSGVKTILLHTSGETVESWFELPSVIVGKANNAQNVGASISYIKRYALCAMLGCSSDEDTDGAVVQRAVEQQTRPQNNGFNNQQFNGNYQARPQQNGGNQYQRQAQNYQG